MRTIFAHRGVSSEAPENTLPAFRLALDQGCKAIELDVQLTKDHQLVVFHDDKLERTTNGEGYLKDFTLSELKQKDAGKWYSEEFQGVQIPTLREVLELVDRNILVNIEIKNVPFFLSGNRRIDCTRD